MNRRNFLLGLGSLALGGRAWSQARVSFVDTHLHPLRNGFGSMSSAVSAALREMDRFGIEKAVLLPPPFPESDSRLYGLRELSAAVRGQSRLAFTAGGESLNPMLQAAKGRYDVARFTQVAEGIAAAGAAAFGELALEHFSSGRGRHPYESSPPDHPLLLALADIAARQGMPIELHMEAVPQDMVFPANRPKGPNPDRLHANIAAFERLLEHNPQARVVWAHAGWDPTGMRTPALMETLLGRHANLFMSIKSDSAGSRMTALMGPQGLQPNWVAMLQSFPGRFVIGSDEFVEVGTERLQSARRLIDLLPADLARRIGSENARQIYRLT